MMNPQLYELAQIREQEYMMAATARHGRSRSSRILAGVARRLRRHSDTSQS